MKQARAFAPLLGGMDLSDDKKYRYSLWCRWSPGPSITWIMFNPSDADLASDKPGHITPDPTINQIVRYSKRHRPKPFGALRLVNLFAWRDSCAACTLLRTDAVGENDARLKPLLQGVEEVAIAWGSLGRWRRELNLKAQARERLVHQWLGDTRRLCLCRVDKGAYPGHPMYKSPDLTLTDWEVAPPCR